LPVLGACNQDPSSSVLICDPETRWAIDLDWPFAVGILGTEIRKNGVACYSERQITVPGDSGTVFSNGNAPIAAAKPGSDAQGHLAQLVWCGPYTSTQGLHESNAFIESSDLKCRSWRETYLGLGFTTCRTTQPGSCAGL
jgi:hypothetical protein